MKKIIGMACCAFALATASFGEGGLEPIECGACGAGETETSCQIWFSGKGSGKISTVAKSQMYKTVKTLKITSCKLIVAGGESNATAKVVVKGTKKKVGSFEKTLECSEFVWNVFGKKLNSKKDGTLDSEMWFKASDEDGSIEVAGVLTGKVKAKVTGGCTPCGDTTATKWTPGKFKGRFIGRAIVESCDCASELTFDLGEGSCEDKNCLAFIDPEDEMVEMFDGTITLNYDSKNSGYKTR
jgi:hypothetical protein